MPIQRVDRPRIVRRRDVEDAVHLEDRSRQTRRPARGPRHAHRLVALTPEEGGRPGRRPEEPALRAARSSGEAAHPGEGDMPDVARVDLCERAVTTLRAVTRI